jgi:E3 ubiquitin-protein ligase MARCH5
LEQTLSISQVVGHKEGLDVMERVDPLFLLIGLPTIPVMLILGKMIRWEDYVLRLWRKYSNKLQILNSIFPGKALNYGCTEHTKLILWTNPTMQRYFSF